MGGLSALSGICVGGPKDRQSLATMSGRRVEHPDDPSGFYVWKAASGVEPSKWVWITKKEPTK